MDKKRAKIIGVGKYLPDKILSNADLEKMVDTSDEWITKRVGIKERRISEPDVYSSDLGTEAALNAIKDSGISPEDIDLIIAAGVTPDMYTPSVSCMIQAKIGAVNAAAFDLNAACPGFVFALTTATQFIENGMYKTVLVVACDCLSKVTEYKDRATCVLFGDGAGAAILQATDEDTGVLSCCLGSDGASGDKITIPGIRVDEEEKEKRPFGNYRTLWMDGGAVYKFAVKTMSASAAKVIEDAGFTMEDITQIIPHQANQRIIDGARKRLGCAEEQMFSNISKYGNMSAACIPVAICEAIEEGKIKRGDLFVIVSMGGGLAWGSALIRY